MRTRVASPGTHAADQFGFDSLRSRRSARSTRDSAADRFGSYGIPGASSPAARIRSSHRIIISRNCAACRSE